jgi:hypothetical protein
VEDYDETEGGNENKFKVERNSLVCGDMGEDEVTKNG